MHCLRKKFFVPLQREMKIIPNFINTRFRVNFKADANRVKGALINMTRQEKERYGVPSVQNVDYNRVYVFHFGSNGLEITDLFTPYLRNRGALTEELKRHIKYLKGVILDYGGMEKLPPIFVDSRSLTIVDGNLRGAAGMDLHREGKISEYVVRVLFLDVEEDELDDCVVNLNQGQKSWTTLNFIYNYSLRGLDSFTKLIEFCNSEDTLKRKNGTPTPRYAAAALNVPTPHLKKKNLTLTDDDIKKAHQVIQEAAEIRKYFNPNEKANGGGWYEAYLRAWGGFREELNGISFQDYLKEVITTVTKRKRDVIVPYGSNVKADWNSFFRTVKTYIH